MRKIKIEYDSGGYRLEGYAVIKDKKRPLVLLCHAWNGKDEFICNEADLIACWEYNTFVLDVYGKGKLGKSKSECQALKQPLIEDRYLLKIRLLAGFKKAIGLLDADVQNTAVLGFGFGGLCALDMARMGLNLKGAISVYGHFDPPSYSVSKPINTKILIVHGYDDPIVSINSLGKFDQEMKKNEGLWEAHIFNSTSHSFMNPSINDPNAGLCYNAVSAKGTRSIVKNFLADIFEFHK